MTQPVFRTWFKSAKKAQLMADALRKIFNFSLGNHTCYVEVTPHLPTNPDPYQKAGYRFRVIVGCYATVRSPEPQFLSTALLIGEALGGYNQVSMEGEYFRMVKKDKLETACRNQDVIFLKNQDILKDMGISLNLKPLVTPCQ